MTLNKESEVFIGVSTINDNLKLSDIFNSNGYLHDGNTIGKYYEIVEIDKLNWLRMNGKGRCTYCHANIDKTCGIKVSRCLNSTKTCYRRKYKLS